MAYFLVFWAMLAPCLVIAQNVSFQAIPNRTEVSEGEPFELRFELTNARILDIQFPDLSGFDAMGPSQMVGYSAVNGQTTTTETRSFTLYPKRLGKITIGAATVKTNTGKTLSSSPIVIEVVKQGSSKGIGDLVFIRTVLSNTAPMVGEQVSVETKIYTQIGIEQYQLLQIPEAPNVYSKDIQLLQTPPVRETINGRNYITQTLHKTVIFPAQAGKLAVSGAMIQVGIIDPSQRDPFNPYGQLVAHTLKSEAVELEVLAPANAPAGYKGAVGEYDFLAYAEKTAITTDENLRIFVRINGMGDLKQVFAPNIQTPEQAFEQFEPNATEEIRENGSVLGGVKTFEYVLSPRQAGRFEIRPQFVFYQPSTKKFITKDTLFVIEVALGKNPLPVASSKISKLGKDTLQNQPTEVLAMRAPQTETVLSFPKRPFMGSWGFWGLSLLPVIGFGYFKYQQKNAATLAAIPLEVQHQQKAAARAKNHLQKAEDAQAKADYVGMHQQLISGIRQYLADKTKSAPSELSKPAIQTLLETANIQPELIQQVLKLIAYSEMAVYAGLLNPNDTQKQLEEAKKVLAELEKNWV